MGADESAVNKRAGFLRFLSLTLASSCQRGRICFRKGRKPSESLYE